jgi:serine/threonine protein kinase
MYKLKLNPIYKYLDDYLINIKQYFYEDTNTIHKARNELKIISHAGVSTVVKSFKIPHLFNKIIYTFFRDSKAKKSYEYSLKLGDFAPPPIGYIEFFNNGLLDESYFISEEFIYNFTIREPLLQKNFINREKILQAFANFTLQLHNSGIYHEDYSPGNILIREKNGKYIFKIVDVNRMRFFKLSCNERAKNFSKLWASEEDLTIIAKEYVKSYTHCNKFVQQVLYYSLQNKKIKNFKKRLKGKEIDW